MTLVTDFVGMASSLWLAFYLIPRGRANPLTFRLLLALLALGFYYFVRLTFGSGASPFSTNFLAFAVVIVLTAIHNLSHYLLPRSLQAQYVWIPRGILLLALVTTIVALTVPIESGELLFVDYPTIDSPYVLVGLFDFLAASAIAWNLVLIFRTSALPINRSFILALILAVCTIAYSFVATVLQVALPQFVAALMVLCSLFLIGYSVARHQVLIERRTLTKDLPASAVIAFVLTMLYVFIAFALGLSTPSTALLTALIIITHGSYGWVREHFLRQLSRQDRDIAGQIRQIGRHLGKDDDFDQLLRRSLAIVCHTLQAPAGFIAQKRNDNFVVRSSLRSLRSGVALPEWEGQANEVAAPLGPLRDEIAWLVPGFGGGEKQVILGIAERSRLRSYALSDLEWLQDVADQLGLIVYSHQQESIPTSEEHSTTEEVSPSRHVDTGKLVSTLSHKPNGDLVKAVEDGFRNLHDYLKLGKSPLVMWLGISGETHIERGRQVQTKLIDTLETLRPEGEIPKEPLPRAWRSYTILNYAYVEDVPDREIMARLFISEGTFYRTRRKAIRGITHALLESAQTNF